MRTRAICSTATIASLVVGLALIPGIGRAFGIEDCGNGDRKENVRQAFQYLVDNKKTLGDFEFDGRLPRQDERFSRRLKNRMDRFTVRCLPDDKHICGGGKWGIAPDTTLALATGGPFLSSRRIAICYDNIAADEANNASTKRFCALVGSMAHELGHSFRIPARVGHNDGPNNDWVYQFEHFAKDMCKEDRMNRRISDSTTPNDPSGREPPDKGIVLYQKKNFERSGRGRNFESSGESDLRDIGWNDSVSSVKVLDDSAWLLCKHTRSRGWCAALFDDESSMKDLKRNNSASALVRYGTLAQGQHTVGLGVSIYKHDKFNPSRVQLVRRDYPNIHKELKVSDITGLIVHQGSWEFCQHKDYKGKCETFHAGDSVAHLKEFKLNDKVSSIRRVDQGHQSHTIGRPWGWPGGYVGGGIGAASISSATRLGVDDTETLWAAHLGFAISEDYAAEIGYSNVNDFESDGASASLKSLRVMAVRAIQVEEYIRLFGKAGLVFVTTDISELNSDSSDDEIRLGLGVGVDYQLTDRWSLRLDMDWIDTDPVGNLWTTSVAASWRF